MADEVNGTKLHRDILHLIINETKYDLKINSAGTDFIKPTDPAFIEASEIEKLLIPDAPALPTGSWALYYKTDVKAEHEAEKDYTIKLTDKQGLTSEELKTTAKAIFPVFYVRGTGANWYTSNVPEAAFGNDSTGNGTKQKPYATIAKALIQCTASNIPYIILADGTVEETSTLNIENNKIITIVSLRKNTPAIIYDNRNDPTAEQYLLATAGTLTLDSVILKANKTGTHAPSANTFICGIQQNGGAVTVKGNTTEIRNFAHAVKITGGTFTMEAGSICNNYVNGGSSGVDIRGGKFILKEGSIKDNEATNMAGVYVKGTDATNKGIFTMTGGEISGNKAWCFGGGIYVDEHGQADISGGTIKANHAAQGVFSTPPKDVGGGGICIKGGTVNFTGGTIEKNIIHTVEKNCGAGVFIGEGGTFNMSGGTIKDCTTQATDIPQPSRGIGVYVSSGTSVMKMSGSAKIDTNNDVYLDNDAKIKLDGALTGTAPVALITVPNSNYQTTTQVLTGSNITSGSPQNYKKFEVTPQTTPSLKKWEVDSNGKLKIKP
ncbi:hypothetical protein JM98_00168 [Treponema putidum]|nr:hypothetical protein JM98_00168 [Treponema putidum]